MISMNDFLIRITALVVVVIIDLILVKAIRRSKLYQEYKIIPMQRRYSCLCIMFNVCLFGIPGSYYVASLIFSKRMHKYAYREYKITSSYNIGNELSADLILLPLHYLYRKPCF